MANVIKHKRGSGSDPSASNLVVGELAIRTDNGKLFTKMDSGAIAEIAGGGSDIAINTLSSSSATGGGSATFNGSAYRFTLSSPPSVSAAQLLVSVNGVIQKPVAGTGQPSEGFSVDGNDIIFGDAPATGADFFILTFRSLGVSEPADNSVTSAKIVDGTITGTDLATNVDLVNNQKIRFGANNELQIFRSGTESLILENQGNNLNLAANRVALLRADRHTVMLLAIANGGVEIYHNNSKKIETTSSGVLITGHLDLNDGDAIKLGSGDDLQIYHSGSGSFIQDTGTGNLNIASDAFRVLNAGATENMITADENGAVSLYYDNSKKFETYSNGLRFYGHQIGQTAGAYIQVAGASSNAFAIGMTSGSDLPSGTGTDLHFHHWNGSSWDKVFYVNRDFVNIPDSKKIGFGDSNDLQIYHDGSNSVIAAVNTGDLQIFGNSDDILLQAADNIFIKPQNGESGLNVLGDGAVELFYNNSKTFETISSGVLVSGTLKINDGSASNNRIALGNSGDLLIYHDGSNSYIKNNTGMLRLHGTQIQFKDEDNNETMCVMHPQGAVELYYDNSKKLHTLSTGVYVTGSINIQGQCLPTNDHSGLNLGSSSLRWTTVFAANGSINTSDKNEKNTIVESDLGLDFINKLKPISYKWNKDDGKTHYGLIAQDLEETLTSLGKTIANFGGIYKEDDSPMGLGYSELIAPLIKAVQELTAKVEALEAG